MDEPDSILAVGAPILTYVAAGIWGALWGSFLNVCIHRIGLYESVVWPPSRCTSCGSNILPWDNVPIFAWLWLRGRCRACGSLVSIRYPLIESLTAVLSIGLFAQLRPNFEDASLLGHFLCYFAFLCVLMVLAGIDLDHKLLPDRITLTWMPPFFVAGIFLQDYPVRDLIFGLLLGYGMVTLTIWISVFCLGREGMGYGDAKLLALIGTLLGWRGVVVTFFIAPFVGLLIVIPVLSIRKKRLLGVEVPYGPFLVIAALAYLFGGRYLPLPFTAPF